MKAFMEQKLDIMPSWDTVCKMKRSQNEESICIFNCVYIIYSKVLSKPLR